MSNQRPPRLLVNDSPCANCLFSNRNLFRTDISGFDITEGDEEKLAAVKEAVTDKVREAVEADTYFNCHLNGRGFKNGNRVEPVCCATFYQRYKSTTLVLKLARVLGIVKFVDFRKRIVGYEDGDGRKIRAERK